MSTFEIDITNVVLFYFLDFFTLLVSKVEICRKYFLNKNSQKQPLCSLYCRGRQRLSTEHHCEVRHGTLRLSTTLATEGIFLSTNYTPQFNKKSFGSQYRYRNWNLGSVPDAKTWFRSYTIKNLGAIFWNYYLLPLTFYHLFEFPAKDSFWKFFREVSFNQVGDENLGCTTISICKPVCEICYRWVELTFELLSIFYDNKWFKFSNSIPAFNCVSNVYNR